MRKGRAATSQSVEVNYITNKGTFTHNFSVTGTQVALDTAAGQFTNTGAEVQAHPSGNFVYVSNRGDDDLGVFTVGSDGKLTPTAHTKTGGQTPRHFSIDPSGRWLLVANQGSGDVRVFAIDATTGALTPAGSPVTATMPSFVGVVPR